MQSSKNRNVICLRLIEFFAANQWIFNKYGVVVFVFFIWWFRFYLYNFQCERISHAEHKVKKAFSYEKPKSDKWIFTNWFDECIEVALLKWISYEPFN